MKYFLTLVVLLAGGIIHIDATAGFENDTCYAGPLSVTDSVCQKDACGAKGINKDGKCYNNLNCCMQASVIGTEGHECYNLVSNVMKIKVSYTNCQAASCGMLRIPNVQTKCNGSLNCCMVQQTNLGKENFQCFSYTTVNGTVVKTANVAAIACRTNCLTGEVDRTSAKGTLLPNGFYCNDNLKCCGK